MLELWDSGCWCRLSGMAVCDQFAPKGIAKNCPVSVHTPFVSIVVPACKKETPLEPSLRSLLQQDYPNLEIIIIDDRSTDTTFEVITKLRQSFPEIQEGQVVELPMGWLGKNHVLYLGAKMAQGLIMGILFQPWNRNSMLIRF